MSQTRLQGDLYKNCNEQYEKVSGIFVDILNHHAPLKEKQIRGNHAPFMNRELNKVIMKKSKTRIGIWNGHPEKITYLTKSLKINVIHWPKKQRKSFLRKLQKTWVCLINSFGVLSNLF